MRIDKLCLYNFGPFLGEHVFAFSRKGLILICGKNHDDPRCDSNGSGKSSLFDALDWALFGKVPRGDHVDSVVHDQATSCQVRVELSDDSGRPVVIERRRGKETNLRYWVGAMEGSALDVKETQAQIERVLGVDRATFHAAVYFGQNDIIRYADSTDAERMETLTRILQLDEIDDFLERSKVLLQDAQARSAAGEAAMARLRAERDALAAQNFTEQSQAWEAQRAHEVATWKAEYAQRMGALGQAMLDATAQIPGAQQVVEQLRAEMDAIAVPPEIPQALRQRLAEAQAACGAASFRLGAAQRALDACQPMGEVCSACGQPIPEALRFTERSRKEHELAVAQEDHFRADQIKQSAQAEVNQAETVRAAASAGLVQRRLQLRNQFEVAQRTLAEHQSTLQAVAAARPALVLLDQRTQARAAEVNPYLAYIADQARRISEIDGALAAEQILLASIQQRARFLEFWKTAFGPSGLKSYILDARLTELTEAANRWVRLLTGGVFWVQFQSQRQTRGKKIVNAPEVRVARWNPDGTITERNYRSLSGGEKQRISFPIDFGLSHLLASRSRQRYDLLLLDEVFKHLDRTGKGAMVEMLELLAREKGAVYVIEHDAEMQGMFEQKVWVEKRNRCSVIREEIADVQHAEKAKPAPPQVEHRVPSGAAGEPPVRRPVQRTPVPR